MGKRILGILAGEDMGADLLKKWALSADILIAADGAADQLLNLGVVPNAIVGDFDSVSAKALECGAELYKNSDQSSTDCDKLLAYCDRSGFFPLTLASLEGDRLDHVLDSVYSVAKSAIRSQVTIALRRGLGWVVGSEGRRQPSTPGQTASLLPLTACEGVSSRGLKWSLANAGLEAGRLTSISNEATADQIELELKSGLLLLVVEHAGSEFPIW